MSKQYKGTEFKTQTKISWTLYFCHPMLQIFDFFKIQLQYNYSKIELSNGCQIRLKEKSDYKI